MKRKYEITEFGKICRKIRLEKDMEQKEMAEILKISTSSLCCYELGKSKIPYRLGIAIAKSFDLTETEKLYLEKIIKEHNVEFNNKAIKKREETYKRKAKENYENLVKETNITEVAIQKAIIELLDKQTLELEKINAKLELLLEKKKRKRWF